MGVKVKLQNPKESAKNGESGYVLTTLERAINNARADSLWPLTFGLACCSAEMAHARSSCYDLERFGTMFVPSPSQADLLILAGVVTNKMAPVIRNIYDQMPFPKYVIAMGACASGGGHYNNSYAVVKGADEIIPVDVYVPGCPPTPQALIYGILQLQKKVREGK